MRMRASGRSSLRLCLAVLAWGTATAGLAAGAKSIDAAAAAATASALTAADDFTGKLPTGSVGAALPDLPAPAPPAAPTGFDTPHAAVAPVAAPAPATGVSATVNPADQPAATSLPGTSAPAPADPSSSPSVVPPLGSAALHQALEAFAKTATPGAAEYRLADPLLQKQHAEIAEFYALRGDEPVWVEGGQWTPIARRIIEFLSHAGTTVSTWRPAFLK